MGYTLPLRGEDKLEAGFESQLEGSEPDYQVSNFDSSAGSWQPDARSSHPYTSSHAVHSLYATYAWSWHGLGVQPGLRGEYGERTIHVLDTDSLWQAVRWDYFPTLHTSYSFAAGQQVTASYSRRIDRPGDWYLRPFPVWFDAHNVSVGNPNLRPSYANSWELGVELPFGANSVGAEGYYRTTTDMVEQVTSKYPADTTVLMSTSQNVGKDRSIGVELTANVSPVKWFTAYVSADLSDYYEWGALFGQDFSKRTFYWTSSANLTFRLPTNTSIQLDGNFSGPSITAISNDDGWFGANLAVKQTMFNRALSVTLRLGNLLGARTWKSRSEGQGFSSRVSRTYDGLTVGLAVSYNLNNFKFDPKMRAGEGTEMRGGGGGGPGQ
jgi:outer membrane receptor protein involved in Fe transport